MISKTFCVMPWYNLDIVPGMKPTPCCLLPNNANIDQIKKDLLSGIPSDSCKKCWDIESQNKDSKRIQENRFLDWKMDRDIEKIEQDCRDDKASVLSYQITTSNLCNQACVTCGSIASTKWQEIERKAGIKTVPLTGVDIDTLDINYKQAVRINFLGGEPTFDPRTFYILEKLYEHNNTDCFISIITNGYIAIPKKYVDLLKQFSNINICFSIDGIESRFEYMRWPAKWNNLLNVIDDYRNITNNFSVSYTISAVNCLYYQETVDWLNSQNLRYNHNIVYKPNWVALSQTPLVIKDQIADILFFSNISEHNGNEISTNKFLEKLHHQDKLKNICLQDYMPELALLLDPS